MYPDMVVYDMNTWDHVVAFIVCILAPVLAMMSRKVTVEEVELESPDKIRLYHSNSLLMLVFSLMVLTAWRLPGRTLESLGFTLPEKHPYVPFLLLAVVFFYFLDMYLMYGTRRRREKTKMARKAYSFIPEDNKEFFHFSLLAIAGGIGEEIIFRGFLIQYFISWTGNSLPGIAAACIASSLLFAFLHGYQGIVSILKVMGFALIFSAIFVLSGSLLLVIILHASIDIVSGILNLYLLRKEE